MVALAALVPGKLPLEGRVRDGLSHGNHRHFGLLVFLLPVDTMSSRGGTIFHKSTPTLNLSLSSTVLAQQELLLSS